MSYVLWEDKNMDGKGTGYFRDEVSETESREKRETWLHLRRSQALQTQR